MRNTTKENRMNIVHVECCSSTFWLLGLAFSAKCLFCYPIMWRDFYFFYNPPLRKPVGAQRLLNLIRIWKMWDTVTNHIWEAKWIHPSNAPSLPFPSGLIRWSWTAALIPRTCTEIRVCLNSRRAFSTPPPPSGAFRCVFPLVRRGLRQCISAIIMTEWEGQ